MDELTVCDPLFLGISSRLTYLADNEFVQLMMQK